ncbi:MAG: carbon-nitrogen hydrolase family protein, partial [Bacteroidota bacterium]
MRQVRIATTSFLVEDTPHSVRMNLDRSEEYIELAAKQGADILCLPEMVTTANVIPEFEYSAEEYPGEWTRAFRSAAKENKINLIAPYLVRDGKRVYNQATV